MINFVNGVSISLSDINHALCACQRRLQLQADEIQQILESSSGHWDSIWENSLKNIQRNQKIIDSYKGKVSLALTSHKLQHHHSLLRKVKALIYVDKSMHPVVRGWDRVVPILYHQIYQPPVPVYNHVEKDNELKLHAVIHQIYFSSQS